MRYPDSHQRHESFRRPSRRLPCVNSANHTAHLLLGFACPGKKVISSLLDSKRRVSRVRCLLSSLHPQWLLVRILSYFKGTATQGLNYTGFQKSPDPGSFWLRVDQQMKLAQESVLFECKLIGGSQYLFVVVALLLLLLL